MNKSSTVVNSPCTRDSIKPKPPDNTFKPRNQSKSKHSMHADAGDKYLRNKRLEKRWENLNQIHYDLRDLYWIDCIKIALLALNLVLLCTLLGEVYG